MKPMQHEHAVELVVSDDLKATAARIRNHFEENKKLYATGIGGFALGYILRKPQKITITNEIAPTFVTAVPDI